MVLGDTANTTDFVWATNSSTQVLGLRFRNQATQSADFGSYPDDGQFHHWVVISDGAGTISAYRDNVPQTDVLIGGQFNITSVGHAYNTPIFSMNGQIDELYIYDQAIDATRVSELFTGVTNPSSPTLASGDIVDNKSGGPVLSGTVVTYTMTFSKDMDDTTFDVADFGNAGSAAFTVGAITEISPGVFTVEITPTSGGTLQLAVLSGASLSDASGNPLVTSSSIPADLVITVQASVDPSAVKRVRVYLLGGQSNADGRADPAGLPTSPVNLQAAQADVDFYEGSLTTLQPLGGEFGPEITWGRCLADRVGDGLTTRVALVKYATGGTDLHTDWKSGGDATTTNDGPNYVAFQSRVASGLAALASAYPNAIIEIEGMLWVQGERDAGSGTVLAGQYEANLTNFIVDVRLTYGDIIFVISRLSSDQTAVNATGLATIRAAQDAVAAADPLSPLVDTDGFGMKTDNLHFDALGQQQIGDAACAQLLNLYPFLSPLAIALQSGGDVTVTVNDAFSGFVYTLSDSGTMQAGDWGLVEEKMATGKTLNFSVTPNPVDDRRFYRVERTLAP
jgi:hypothetical protein